MLSSSYPSHLWTSTTTSLAAIPTAKEVAMRLRDNSLVMTAAMLAEKESLHPRATRWLPQSTARGHSGLAVMAAYLDTCFPNEGWDIVGHHHLAIAVAAAEEKQFSPLGLFEGISGIAFAAKLLSRDGTRYQKLQSKFAAKLFPDINALAKTIQAKREGLPEHYFDVISGLTGMGIYLLCHRESPEAERTLQSVAQSLIYLLGEDEGIPRWHTPGRLIPNERWRNLFPHGLLNCGLAHGIPGPLALLSLIKLHGVEVSGIEATIKQTADWIIAHRIEDAWGMNWPITHPADPHDGQSKHAEPSRTAWCYGNPGIARTLWLAGESLDLAAYREVALAAMASVYQKPISARNIDSPTFCHGVAGLLQITLRFAHDTGNPMFTDAANTLIDQLLSLYEPATLLGYRNIEAPGRSTNQPGLLDGAAGVILVLLAASTTHEPVWDRLFLLA